LRSSFSSAAFPLNEKVAGSQPERVDYFAELAAGMAEKQSAAVITLGDGQRAEVVIMRGASCAPSARKFCDIIQAREHQVDG
jgi:hypothetical protein